MFTHTQRSKFYDLSCSDCLRLKVTGFKRNYLPYLSVLPFCLVALSTSFAFNSEAAEVPQPTENTPHEISVGGGYFNLDRKNLLLIL